MCPAPAITQEDIMETPTDIIVRHFAELNIPFDIERAADIAEELAQKFTMIANEDIDAVEITHDRSKAWFVAGDGPEEVICSTVANPNWLRNKALHALAVARHLETKQAGLPDNSRGRARAVAVTPAADNGEVVINVRVTGNPMLVYFGTDKRDYRLDDGYLPGSVGFPSAREAQIALALTDLSASRLHEVTR